MRVVSLVPSWTETLIEAGVEVVGRSRYCIHPSEKVEAIPAVGGTKNWDFERIRELNPDLLVLDREENPKFMADQEEFATFASHVTDLRSVATALTQLGMLFKNPVLSEMAGRWKTIAAWPGLPAWRPGDELPGLIEWGRPPEAPITNVIYMIWRAPWMGVSKDTFIGSVLSKCGFASYLRGYETKYPHINLADFSPANTLILFSSEPYPFLRKRSVLKPVDHPYAFVDGECFSWFGIRALEFLEKLKPRV